LAAAGPATAQDFGVWTAASLHGPYAGDRLSTPSDAEVMAAWPARAAARKLPGNALAACKADIAGKLSGCRLMVERPANAGFGEALLALAPKYRLRYAPEGARPAQAEVLISASWPVPDTAPDWLRRLRRRLLDLSPPTRPGATDGPELSVMNCLLGKLGTLYQCVVVYQDPPGIGLARCRCALPPTCGSSRPAGRKTDARGLDHPFKLEMLNDASAPVQVRSTDMEEACPHVLRIADVTPSALGCEECLKIGSEWLHLRLCRTCGHVGCCDQSPNRHATGAFPRHQAPDHRGL
jgi:hypothetical protein